jgi:hypothetical protein
MGAVALQRVSNLRLGLERAMPYVPILRNGSDLAEAMPCVDKERGSRPILPSPMGETSLDLLARMRLGRLACAQGTQPYVVTFYFAYDNDYLGEEVGRVRLSR